MTEQTTVYPLKILTALHEVMGKVGYVQKKGKNSFQNYKYAGEGNLLEVLRPAMVEAGLLLIPSHRRVSEIDANGITNVEVEYTLAHKDGDVWPEKIIVCGAGGDKNSKGVGDKGLYKALTGANKYLLFKLFQIETGDDPEKDSDHDKDDSTSTKGAQQNQPQKRGNTHPTEPGVSKFSPLVHNACRDLLGTSDEDELSGLLNSKEFKQIVIQSCRDFPSTWTGPEEFSGLRGQIERMGKELRCEQLTTTYLVNAENAARKPVQQAAE